MSGNNAGSIKCPNFKPIVSPTLINLKRFQIGKIDVFSEIVSQTKVLNLIKKWFSFPGKMLFFDWDYFYLKFDGIYK